MTARRFAILAAALVAAAVVLTEIAACAPRTLQVEPRAAPTPVCLRVEYLADAQRHHLLACLDTAVQCRRGRAQVLKYGAFGNVVAVGDCKGPR